MSIIDCTISPRSAGSRRRSPGRLNSSSRSVIFLQRKASSWIMRKYLVMTSSSERGARNAERGTFFCSALHAPRSALRVPGEACLQRLGAEVDAGQRVVDLMGDTGGQEANAGQTLRAHQLPAALVDLMRQVAVQGAQPAGHVVEGTRQVLDLVAAV